MNATVEASTSARPPDRGIIREIEQPPPDPVIFVPSAPKPDEQGIRRKSSTAHQLNALGELAGGIAHDFRNVLAVISSAIRLAEGQGGGPRRTREYLTAAQEGVERGLRLTSRLLALAKPHAPDLRPADPAHLIRELLPFLKYGAGPRVRIRLELEQSAASCLVDPPQFNQALLNLVVNARDAMADGGEIVIRSDIVPASAGDPLPGGRGLLRIRVSDTGEGMSPETAARIFDPWFTTKGETGTGLGLPQVRRFMTQMGGSISVASAPAIGTAFDLLFPIREHECGGRPLSCEAVGPIFECDPADVERPPSKD